MYISTTKSSLGRDILRVRVESDEINDDKCMSKDLAKEEKKLRKNFQKKKEEEEEVRKYIYMYMQMSYRTEAYRISITMSRNSADRNVAVALTCTLLCY